VTLRPTGILETPDGNLYTVIDDIDTESVVLIPMSYGHRRLAKREDLGAEGVLHEGRSAGVQTGRPEYSIVSMDKGWYLTCRSVVPSRLSKTGEEHVLEERVPLHDLGLSLSQVGALNTILSHTGQRNARTDRYFRDAATEDDIEALRAGLSPLAAERDSDADSGGGEDDRVV
jgi:hypothetical protein